MIILLLTNAIVTSDIYRKIFLNKYVKNNSMHSIFNLCKLSPSPIIWNVSFSKYPIIVLLDVVEKLSGLSIFDINELTIHKEAVFIITYKNENSNDSNNHHLYGLTNSTIFE
tara:strand:- start:795 stop:1130 length:336 start_codon:yes stop_codon:yes gene_type:complete